MQTQGIALFGYYRSAVEVATYLRTGGHRVGIIDDHPENLAKAREAGFETGDIDFRDDTELAKLGLGREIDTVFCLFPDDAENVFLTISARALAPDIRILSICHGRSAVPNLRAAGTDKVIETLEITGLRIWGIITRPVVTAILDCTLFGTANLNVAELPLPEDNFLIGRPVVESGIDQAYELILLGVVDQSLEEHFVHSPGTQSMHLRAGDILVVIGPADAIEKLRRNLEKNGPPDS